MVHTPAVAGRWWQGRPGQASLGWQVYSKVARYGALEACLGAALQQPTPTVTNLFKYSNSEYLK